MLKRFNLLLILIVLLISYTNAVYSLKKVKSPIPDQQNDKWLLAHIDVETTGLIPGYHEMIDIGVVITDLSGDVIDSLFLRIQAKHPERLEEGALKVNSYNYIKWKKLGAISTGEAVNRIISFNNKVKGSKEVMMVSHNSHFDAAFIDHLFRGEKKSWRELFYYYILDIPSMAWGLGVTHNQIMDYYNIKDEPIIHTGIAGAMLNVRVYRAILKYRKEICK